MLANYWQGRFPFENNLDDGWLRTSPVGSFPANGFGLYDMIGMCGSGPTTGGPKLLNW